MSTKITLRPAGAGDDSQDVVLGDGSDRTSANGVGPINGTTTVNVSAQQVNAIGAEFARFIGRGNRSGSLPFQTSRHFSSMADAGRYWLTHGMTVAAAGTLIFDFGDEGTLGVVFGCVLRQIGALSWNGKQVQGSYSAVYGKAALVAAASLQDEINAYSGLVATRAIDCGAMETAATGFEEDNSYSEPTYISEFETTITGYGDTPEAVYLICRWRAGDFFYEVKNLPAGSYTVRLHFAECYYEAAAARVFYVHINGTAVLEDFDVYDEAGGKDIAHVEEFVAASVDGAILIEFLEGSAGGPFVCGIEIEPYVEET